MKKLYLTGTIVTLVLVLVAAFAQFGGTCTLYLFNTNSCVIPFLQMAALGAIVGGLGIIYWRTPKENLEDTAEDEVDESPMPTSEEEKEEQ